jgi:small conductance mechanosensitive channel
MDTTQITAWLTPLVERGTDIGLRLVGALLLFFLGRMVMRGIHRFVTASLVAQKLDPTVQRYLISALDILLNVILAIAILGVFGVETTTFAGLIAAFGVAIGMAWSGLLSNFAAGFFLLTLRPFKVGDYVSAAGVEGTVDTIGLFVTAINAPDNVRTFVGNNAIFSATIKNFSANPYRRAELVAQLAGGADHNAAIALLKERMRQIPNVMVDPAPDAEILEHTLVGPILAVRPYCHTDHYWQVYFDTNKLIREALAEAGFPAPTPAQIVHLADRR